MYNYAIILKWNTSVQIISKFILKSTEKSFISHSSPKNGMLTAGIKLEELLF